MLERIIDLWDIVQEYWDKLSPTSLPYIILYIIIGGLIKDHFPKIIRLLWRGIKFVFFKVTGDRFRSLEFQKEYLNWVIRDLRGLKLTGIISNDETKKPQLEQVFVTLKINENKESSTESQHIERVIEKVLKNYNEIPFWNDLFKQIELNIKNVELNNLNDFREILLEKLEKNFVHYKQNFLKRGFKIIKNVFSIIIFRIQVVLFKLHNQNISTTTQMKLEICDIALNTHFFHKIPENYKLSRIIRDNQKVAILGGPGAGKTTILQFLGLSYSREKAGDKKLRKSKILKRNFGLNTWFLPIFIPLRSIVSMLSELTEDGRIPSIFDVLPTLLPPDIQREYQNIIPKYLEKMLSKGKCILLIDGLDEVSSEEQYKVVMRALDSFIMAYGKNKFIITSRINGIKFDLLQDFSFYYVKNLDSQQINRFIDSWHYSVERNAIVGRVEDESVTERRERLRRAKINAEELKSTLKANEGIRRLATNPMLLSIIALVHKNLAYLPKERCKLYAKCSEILLEQWDISRGVKVDDTKLKLNQKEIIIHRIAFAFHSDENSNGKGSRELSRKEVELIISQILPDMGISSENAPDLLRYIIDRSGVISENRLGYISFSHLTFQEYYTAKFIQDKDASQIGKKPRYYLLEKNRLYSNWWQEVILLYSGLLNDSSSFISEILKNGSQKTKYYCLRLSALCLRESNSFKYETKRQEIAQGLLKIHTLGKFNNSKEKISNEEIGYLLKSLSYLDWYKHVALSMINRIDENNNEKQIEDLYQLIENVDEENQKIVFSSLDELPDYAISDKLIEFIIPYLDIKNKDFSIVINKLLISLLLKTKEIDRNLLSNLLKRFFNYIEVFDPNISPEAIKLFVKYSNCLTKNELKILVKAAENLTIGQCFSVSEFASEIQNQDLIEIFVREIVMGDQKGFLTILSGLDKKRIVDEHIIELVIQQIEKFGNKPLFLVVLEKILSGFEDKEIKSYLKMIFSIDNYRVNEVGLGLIKTLKLEILDSDVIKTILILSLSNSLTLRKESMEVFPNIKNRDFSKEIEEKLLYIVTTAKNRWLRQTSLNSLIEIILSNNHVFFNIYIDLLKKMINDSDESIKKAVLILLEKINPDQFSELDLLYFIEKSLTIAQDIKFHKPKKQKREYSGPNDYLLGDIRSSDFSVSAKYWSYFNSINASNINHSFPEYKNLIMWSIEHGDFSKLNEINHNLIDELILINRVIPDLRFHAILAMRNLCLNRFTNIMEEFLKIFIRGNFLQNNLEHSLLFSSALFIFANFQMEIDEKNNILGYILDKNFNLFPRDSSYEWYTKLTPPDSLYYFIQGYLEKKDPVLFSLDTFVNNIAMLPKEFVIRELNNAFKNHARNLSLVMLLMGRLKLHLQNSNFEIFLLDLIKNNDNSYKLIALTIIDEYLEKDNFSDGFISALEPLLSNTEDEIADYSWELISRNKYLKKSWI